MKKKILIICSIVVAVLSIVSVYAAYSYSKSIDGDATTGEVEVISKHFLFYDIVNDVRSNTPMEFDVNQNVIDEENGINISQGKITSYASKKLGYSDDLPYTHLNQLGIKAVFKAEVDVYVRLRVQDAWKSRKIYKNGNISTNSIVKGNAISTALSSDENWKYDAITGYIYYKTMVESSSDEITIEFDFPSDYYYPVGTASYRESVIVDLSFKVDIVQAHRASSKWGFDVEDYLAN